MAFLRAATGVVVCALAGQVLRASGNVNAFLAKELPKVNLHAQDLLGELERVLGTASKGAMEERATKIKVRMTPIYTAMPRNSADRLDPAAVRYLLHRYFVARHGWFVLGFDTAGEAWNSSSPTAVLAKSNASGVFDKLDSKGLTLHEVSLLAATLESFVHTETEQRLHAAYHIHNITQKEKHSTEQEAVMVLDTYMMFYVLGLNATLMANSRILEVLHNIQMVYPTWNATRKWIHEVRKEIVSASPNRNSFDTTVRVVEEIGDRYGRWQDQECTSLKESLLGMEKPGTGRVPMNTFYAAAMKEENWQFSESIEYLRQLGVIDDSDTARPSVIIANYINSPANCVAASSFYSVCCINECEELLSHVELNIAAPSATPVEIISVVEKLPSATVDAPRTLSEPLQDRLESIAKQHGGVVPFHARLFNQWLHHAFPRECPFPLLSGTSKPMTGDEWMRSTGLSVEATEESMLWHIKQHEEAEKAKLSHPDFNYEEDLPWHAEEELFVNQETGGFVDQPSSKSLPRTLAFLSLAGAMGVTLVRQCTTAKDTFDIPERKLV